MNKLEKKMLNTLLDLKENHHVVGVKAEFEAEGTRMEEALRLKEVVTKAGLELTIKIGGCEAIKDMFDARTIGVNTIVAPMIETAYAMKKYVQATKYVFPEEEHKDIKFLINVETITGFNNLDEMISSQYFKDISGVVVGRVDMTGSMGLSRDDINTDAIFEIANDVAKKTLANNKAQGALNRFETRKIIFDAQKAVCDPNADEGILKAVGFELMWLRNKREFYGMIYREDEARLRLLESRYKKLIEDAGGQYE